MQKVSFISYTFSFMVRISKKKALHFKIEIFNMYFRVHLLPKYNLVVELSLTFSA